MKPFWLYLGGKHKLAPHLGRPRYDHVIEPFAGSAGYSVYWSAPRVTLIERDPVICGVWRYLLRVTPAELMRLPAKISHVDELPPGVCEEARWLIGFWLNRATTQPVKRRSKWAKRPCYDAYFWGETIKLRLASQVEAIRHWTIVEGDWTDASDVNAHWHIDAPYENAGKHYRFNHIDYKALAKWCKARRGFIQVCEAVGADWLPFEPLAEITTHHNKNRISAEAVFELENARPERPIARRTAHASLRRRRP